jgi:hypothetical protein
MDDKDFCTFVGLVDRESFSGPNAILEKAPAADNEASDLLKRMWLRPR